MKEESVDDWRLHVVTRLTRLETIAALQTSLIGILLTVAVTRAFV